MPADPSIRRVEERDVDFILELGDETPELWIDEDIKFLFNEEALLDWSDSEGKRGYVFELDGKRIGFGLISVDEEVGEIVAYAIKEEFRGQGHGKYTLKRILEDLEEGGIDIQMLYAGADNARAIEFYSEFGFRKGKKLLMMHRGLE